MGVKDNCGVFTGMNRLGSGHDASQGRQAQPNNKADYG